MRYKTVQLPETMVERIRRVIAKRKELGYVSVKGLVEDAVRRRLEEIEGGRHPRRGVEGS
jgi:metal-responsive CopG/Arc/MetJ family transcriptional regulator